MLSVRGLSKSLEQKQVLRQVTFTLQPGQVVGLIGRNGAGKTTLLKTMAGILLPDEGTVEWEDQSIHHHPHLKQQVIFVPDAPEAFYSYTPRECAGLFASIYSRFDRTYFSRTLERFGLPERRAIRHFSRGMKMAFSTILGLSAGAQYVLLDEPTNGIDPIAKKQVLSLLMEAAEDGTALVISSHLLDELERITDTLFLMKDGEIEIHDTATPANNQLRKFQLVFRTEAPADWLQLPEVHVLEHIGRVYTVLLSFEQGEEPPVWKQLMACEPLLVEPLPLRIEDVFVWKLGGRDHVE